MKKEELLKGLSEDFNKTRGAISEIIDHNRALDRSLVEELSEGDYARLEEHIEISKLIMDGVKSFNELYKNISGSIESISKIKSDKKESKSKDLLKDLMKEDDTSV